MIKLAILGIDNSHAWCFAGKLAPIEGEKIFDDVELIGFYGDYSTEDGKIAVQELKKCSSCTRFAEHYNDFLDEADAIMVTSRHGKYHLEYAREYIKKGIPVWIDKPITCSTEEVCEMIELAKKYNCPLTGGSGIPHLDKMKTLIERIKPIRETIYGGHVTAPANMSNPYGNFWFYTQHLVQMITSVFGNDIKAVKAIERENGVSAIYHYDNYDVTAHFGTDYTVNVYTKRDATVYEHIVLGDEFFVPELKSFYSVIKTGKSDMSYIDIATPVYVIEATIEAFTQKKEVKISVPF